MMIIDLILWDDEDDPEGNVRHIIGPGEVTIAEVEDVLHDPSATVELSRTSGNPIVFGRTDTGKYIAVVFTFEDDPELLIIRPITAYPVPEPGG